jgi:hypothetical protein
MTALQRLELIRENKRLELRKTWTVERIVNKLLFIALIVLMVSGIYAFVIQK